MTAPVIVYIGVGSNWDRPRRQLLDAVRALSEVAGINHLLSSSIYRSPPLGSHDQPDYLNAVVRISTSLAPLALLEVLQQLEAAQGRVRVSGHRWCARLIDLDILLYDRQVIQSERLQVPHYDMHRRAFVLYPLLELAPQLRLPCGASLVEICAAVPRGELRRVGSV